MCLKIKCMGLLNRIHLKTSKKIMKLCAKCHKKYDKLYMIACHIIAYTFKIRDWVQKFTYSVRKVESFCQFGIIIDSTILTIMRKYVQHIYLRFVFKKQHSKHKVASVTINTISHNQSNCVQNITKLSHPKISL